MSFPRLFAIMIGLCLGSSFCSSADIADPVEVRSLSQYGITWHFDRPVKAGRFITGDWWVVGPVAVAKVDPSPGPGRASEGAVVKSRYGAQATKIDNRMRNGSMIVFQAEKSQGYDSRLKNYDPSQSVAFPATLAPGTSLISTISNEPMDVNCLVHNMMWRSEKRGALVLKSAAVLSVLGHVPPRDAFRPPYAGAAKPIFTYSQVKTDRLQNLAPPKNLPAWSDFERYLQRPWLDHMASWLHLHLGPSQNQVNYGREFSRVTGMAALMLNTEAPLEQKRKLIIGLTQLGIDLRGVIAAGRQYPVDGGHYSGRKLPILFAGAMLGDEEMLNPTALSSFAEDYQTYYGSGWAGQKALFQIVVHTGPKPPYEHKSPDTWDKNDKRSESYRTTNSVGWAATALAVRLMGLVKEWNHDAFFDYCDRWMSPVDPYAKNYPGIAGGTHKRNKHEGRTYDRFIDSMWGMYRVACPAPVWAGQNRVWVWSGKNRGEWQANPKPAEPAEPYREEN